LCSLHFRPDADPQNLVAITLFADGAAAAVISCAQLPGAAMAAIGAGRSRVIPGTEDHMTWTVTDSGFAMTLAREVPDAVEQAMREFAGADAAVILHPGGAGIIDACVRAGVVRAGEPSAEVPRAVLREHGNMSSGTVLFVLERMWRNTHRAGTTNGSSIGLPALVAAFGPGLTVDALELAPTTC
jgi:predicted naringenin-chalcone synthase